MLRHATRENPSRTIGVPIPSVAHHEDVAHGRLTLHRRRPDDGALGGWLGDDATTRTAMGSSSMSAMRLQQRLSGCPFRNLNGELLGHDRLPLIVNQTPARPGGIGHLKSPAAAARASARRGGRAADRGGAARTGWPDSCEIGQAKLRLNRGCRVAVGLLFQHGRLGIANAEARAVVPGEAQPIGVQPGVGGREADGLGRIGRAFRQRRRGRCGAGCGRGRRGWRGCGCRS